MGDRQTTDQWLVFTLEDRVFATHVSSVRELTPSHVHVITAMPQTEKHIVGAFNLRGRVISVWDLRTLLGLPSLAMETADIVKLLEQREQDHLNWIRELSKSVDEKREFGLARDPHLCAFGKWYDALMSDEDRLQKMTNSNFTLYRLICQLDTPHRTIHSIADKVTRCVTAGDIARAHEIIEATSRGDLETMVNLLRQIRQLLHTLRKPLIVILEAGQKQIGLQVDSVNSVIRIKPEHIQPVPDVSGQTSMFSGIAQLDDGKKLVMLLDGEALVNRTPAGTRASSPVEVAAPAAVPGSTTAPTQSGRTPALAGVA